MNILNLSDAKALLGITHAFDDARIQLLINAAQAEALTFINRTGTDSWDDYRLPAKTVGPAVAEPQAPPPDLSGDVAGP